MTQDQVLHPVSTTWEQALASAEQLSACEVVCFRDPPRTGAEPCLIDDTSTMAPNEDLPAGARDLGFGRSLTGRQIAAVRENLTKQGFAFRPPYSYEAVSYYIHDDAFIDMTRRADADND